MKIKMRAEYPDAKPQPDKRITILLLGETGVGKSTFVNGIINYPRFESLPETEEDFKRLIWAIGMKYDYTDENYNTVTVSVGRFSDSENINNLGASVTQDPKVHVFTTQGMEVHLIDTPGIGDTAGYEQDKRNCAKIIDFVKDYEIHGICMLLKPNSSRLNIFFRFCLEELLVHLPVDATRNIIFCFTNARSTLYRVGDTFAPLKGLLEERKVDIPLTQDRIYLFDNEAIRFLTARVNGIEFPPDEVESFRESWDRAAKELTRAISFMAKCIPQSGQAIKKLNDVRRVVVSLSVPMAEIAQIIQRNIDFQNRRRDELAMLTGEENDLQERLKMEIVDYVVTMYDQPRTVCTTCANYVDISGSRHVVFEKACHDPCYLDGDTVPAAVVGHPGLLHCAAIGSDNDCLECGHSYLEHMHTMSKAEPKVVVTDNPQVVEKLKTASERRNVIDEEIQRAVDTREEYEHEYKIVMEISVRFTQYINKNAILNFNSSLGDYLQMQIKKLEDMHDRSELDDKCLANYKTSLLRYEEEAKIFQAAVNEGQASVPTSSEIEALVQKLKDLRLTGKIFKDVFQANESLFNCYDGSTSTIILSDSQALMSNAPDSWHLKIDLTPTSTNLMKAAYKGEEKKVNSLLKAGCNQLRCQDKNGCTALMCAAEQGHESIVKSLIDHEHGLRDSRGHTALMYAASNGHLDAVKLLIECEGNIVNNNDCKALLYALKNRHTKIINILLPHEDPVYTRGCTLLMEAAARGDMDTLRLLLSQAREIGQNGMTALMHAAQAGQAQAVQELLPLESGMKNKDGVTALMLGASEGHTAVVRLLAPHEKGLRNNAGSTALVIALQHGFEDIAKILVAEEDPTSPTGETALMRAAGRGDIDIVHLLVPLQKGLQDNRGRVALMYAIEHGHLSAAEALVDHELGFRDADGNTSLDVAMNGGCVDLVKLLVCHGATAGHQRGALSHEDPSSASLLLINAVASGNLQLIQLLAPDYSKMRDATGRTALMHAAIAGDVQAVQILAGFESGEQDDDGYTALMHAVLHGHLDVVVILAKYEFDIHPKTPLIEAAYRGNLNAVRKNKRLLEKLDSASMSALMWAALTDHSHVVAYLAKYEKKLKTAFDQTALMFAAAANNKDIANMLLKLEGGMKDRANRMASFYALNSGHGGIANALVEYEYPITSHITPLMEASRIGDLDTVRLLLHFQVGKQDNFGKTALFYAIINNKIEVVKLLYKHEKDFEDDNGWTPLMLAVNKQKKESIQVILDLEKSCRDADGKTELMKAVLVGSLGDIQRHIGEAGVRDLNGNTALMIAIQTEKPEAAMAILEHDIAGRELRKTNIDKCTALMYAVTKGYVSLVQVLARSEQRMQNQSGMTALMMAARNGNADIVELLLSERGMKDTKGKTALMYAAEAGNLDVAAKLVSSEATFKTAVIDPGTGLPAGSTALMFAAYMQHLNVVELLCKYEAAMQAKDGSTALMYAAMNKCTDIMHILIPTERNITNAAGLAYDSFL